MLSPDKQMKWLSGATFKRLSLKAAPYLTSAIAGLIALWASANSRDMVADLLLNISATLLAVPLLFLIYEVAKSRSEHKLRVKLFDDAKTRIDTQMLSTINQLLKLIIDYRQYHFSLEGILVLLNANAAAIEKMLRESEFAGFQFFKMWNSTTEEIRKLIESVSVHRVLSDDQLMSIVDVLLNIERLEHFLKYKEDIYVPLDRTLEGYRVSDGRDLNLSKGHYSDRLLLLQHLGKSEYKVVDFGDFPEGRKPLLLHLFKVRNHANEFSTVVREILDAIESWVKQSGSEFVMDEKMFKVNWPSTNSMQK